MVRDVALSFDAPNTQRMESVIGRGRAPEWHGLQEYASAFRRDQLWRRLVVGRQVLRSSWVRSNALSSASTKLSK